MANDRSSFPVLADRKRSQFGNEFDQLMSQKAFSGRKMG